jgi:hypothetical protein
MHALDSFTSLVPSFDGSIPILAISVSALPPSDESMSDPSIGASANTLKSWVGKWKETANLTP